MSNAMIDELTRRLSTPAPKVPQRLALIEVTEDGTTIGGAVRKKGDKFSALDVTPATYSLVDAGEYHGAKIVKGTVAAPNRGVPPVTMAYDAAGRPVTLPGDKRLGQVTGINTEAQTAPVMAGAFPTQRERVMVETAAEAKSGATDPATGKPVDIQAQLQELADLGTKAADALSKLRNAERTAKLGPQNSEATNLAQAGRDLLMEPTVDTDALIRQGNDLLAEGVYSDDNTELSEEAPGVPKLGGGAAAPKARGKAQGGAQGPNQQGEGAPGGPGSGAGAGTGDE